MEGPWGTGPYKLVKGFSTPNKRSDQVVLEANTQYWDPSRLPRLRRVIFDNTISGKEAVELVVAGDRRVDMVTQLSPLDTLKVAQSAHAKVVKNRNSHWMVVGLLNMLKTGSPWHDVRLRKAVNLAINRADLIQYAAKGNGRIVPALVPASAFGYPEGLEPYSFDPAGAQALLREAGHPDGLSISLIAPESLRVQATVVTSMLERVGFKVEQQVLDPSGFGQRVTRATLDRPAEQQTWDIALSQEVSWGSFPALDLYSDLVKDGYADWVEESPELQRLRDRVLRTIDRGEQDLLTREMERFTLEQAYFLFPYQPIDLVAVKKTVTYVAYPTNLILVETAVASRAR